MSGACDANNKPDPSTGTSTLSPVEDDEGAVKAIVDRLLAEEDPNALQFTRAEATCIANGAVQAFGLTRLRELGVDAQAGTAPDHLEAGMTSSERDTFFGLLGSCSDLVAKVASAFGEETDPRVARCVAEKYLASGLLQEAIFTSEPDEVLNARIDEAIDDAFAACEGT